MIWFYLLTNGGIYDTMLYILMLARCRWLSQLQKLIDKFYSKPIRNDITFAEVETLAAAFGCDVKSGGKHMRVVHVPSGSIVPIPRHGKNVGEAYIKQLKDLFDRIGNLKEGSL